MLSRTPPNKPNKPNTSSVISSYRKRRMQRGPFLLYGAIALIVIGIILLVVWLIGPNQPLGAMFATDTPTPTLTSTPTNTGLPTNTATITETPTQTLTPTPSGPFPYTLQEGDTLQGIAETFGLGDDGVLLILDYNPTIVENGGVYFVGQVLQIPPPGTTRSTSTPIPIDLPRGTKIEYSVLPGDTLAGIAAKFNSITENIITENNLEDANALQVGQILQIPVNLVTATATLPPTSTPVTPTIAGQPTQAPATSTSASGGPAEACNFTENAAFVSDLQTQINNYRTSNGVGTLSTNAQLTAVARAYAIDMLCNNFFSHIGLDNSTPQSRVEARGFNASVVAESIYAGKGITPQSALNWWKSNAEANADLLNSNTTVFGIAYVQSSDSLFGGYFVVVSAKP